MSWADTEGLRIMLNAGELCDSLAVPDAMEKLVDVLKKVLRDYPSQRVLMVTKAGLYQTKRFLEDMLVLYDLEPERITIGEPQRSAEDDNVL